MPPSQPVSADLLLRHAAALRALARGLLADEHAAEDVVQETWLTALERPPRHDSRIGGWLRTVAKSLAMKRLRGEGRRGERERTAAREEALASTAEVLAERQVLRRVVDAVLALREPFQTAVVLRYYEDLPPREIAARLGVPVATVRSRLHRALAELRRELDAGEERRGEERGHWALALGSLTGLGPATPAPAPDGAGGPPAPAAAGAPPAGVAAMFSTLKLALAATPFVLAAVWLARPTAPEPPALEPASASPRAPSAPASVAPELVAGSAAAQDREAVAPAAASPAAPAAAASLPAAPADPAYTFAIEGVVVRSDDRPVDGADVFLSPGLHPFNRVAETDVDGGFRILWRGRAPTMQVALAVRSGSAWSGLHELEVSAGELVRVRLPVLNVWTARFKVDMQRLEERLAASREEGRPGDEGDELARLAAAARENEVLVRRTADALRFLPSALPQLTWEDAADGVFRGDLGAALLSPPDRSDVRILAEIVRADQVLERRRRVEASEVVELAERKRREEGLARLRGLGYLQEAEPDGPSATLTGLVLDGRGEPVAGARVLVRHAGGELRAASGSDGAFRLEGLPVETEVALAAGGGDHGLAGAARTTPADGETLHWEAVLDRGLELRGALRDEAGAPLAGWFVELVVPDTASGPWYDTATTGEDGSFAIPNLPDAGGSLLLRPTDGWQPVPLWVEPGARAGGAALEVVVPAESRTTGALALSVLDAAGAALEGAEVRVWHAASGRGTWAAWDPEAGRFALAGLAAGRYRVEAGAQGRGWVDLGEVWVPAGGVADLGAARLPEPGALEVRFEPPSEPPAAALAWTVSELRGDVESQLVGATLERGPAGPLAPGSYLVRVAGEAFGALALPLEVRSGETTAATLSLSGARPALLRFVPADGASFGAAAVRYALQDPESGRLVLQQVLEPGADGEATTRVFLAPGPYRLTAGAAGGELGAATLIEVGAGPVEVVLE